MIGFDTDLQKVEALNAGRSYIQHIVAERVRSAVSADLLVATADFSRIPKWM